MDWQQLKKWRLTLIIAALVVSLVTYIVLRVWLTARAGRQAVSESAVLTAISQAADHEVLQVGLGECEFKTEIVNTVSSITQGLSDRASLASDSAMLFVMPASAQYEFWMPRMNFALDMVWLRDGEVVDITAQVPYPAPGTPDNELPKYAPVMPVNFVLEIGAGRTAACQISVGDDLE